MGWKRKRRQDTGWVPLPPVDGVGGAAFVRRIGDLVEMVLSEVVPPTDGHVGIAVIPSGFRPSSLPGSVPQRNGVVSTMDGAARLASAYRGDMRILAAQAGEAYSGHLTWSTNDAMPTGGA